MAIDDSFKKQGAVPFKWEIRPGFPKIQCQQKQREKQLCLLPPPLPSPSPPFTPRRHRSPSPCLQQKLKPPPALAGFVLVPPPEPRTRSFRSTPRTRSERWRFEQPARVRTFEQPARVRTAESVSSGCFPSPFLTKKGSKKSTITTSDLDYASDLETLARWSVSSRRSLSPFGVSPTSPAFSCSSYSYQSSPRLAGDAGWAGFGLF